MVKRFFCTKDKAALTGNTSEQFWMMDVNTGKATKLKAKQEDEEIITYASSDSRDLVILSQRKLDHRPGTISIRSLPDGRELATVTPDAVISNVKFTDNNESIILIGSPGHWVNLDGNGTSLLLWRWHEQKLEVLSEDQEIQSVAVSPDGSFFVTNEGRLDNSGEGRPKQVGTLQLRIWDAGTGELQHTIALDEPVDGIAFSEDSKFLATTKSKQVNVFDARDWSVVKYFKTSFFNNFGGVHFAKNNRLIVAGQKGITIWNSIDDNIFTLPMNSAGVATTRCK